MTEQKKAEAYVRQQRPALMELSFGCEVKDTHNQQYYKVCNKSVNGDLFVSHGSLVSNQYRIAEDRIIIIGHPINLQNWLGVLPDHGRFSDFYWEEGDDVVIQFNRTTGQPATQADFKAFNDIVST